MVILSNNSHNSVNDASLPRMCIALGRGTNSDDDQVINKRNPHNNNISFKVSTWCVIAILQQGKLENIKRKINRCNINIIGLSETR